MKSRLLMGALVALTCMFGQYGFQGIAGAEELTQTEQEAINKAVDQRVQELMRGGGSATQMDGEPVSPTSRNVRDLGTYFGKSQKPNSAMQGSGGLIYARPFVSSPKAIVGGYMDIEYFNRKNQGNSNFDQHHLVPFIYADVSDRVKIAAEIEFEHGNELTVEFATIDYLIQEPVNLRAGIILVPMGKFNLLHDAPLRDLTERPIVDQRILPSTLHQPGVGAYGTFYPSALSKLDYEIYVLNGFTNAFGGEDNPNNTSNINQNNGLRSARSSSTEFDNNNGKSVTGRIAFSPVLGVEVGGSGFYGNYGTRKGDNLAIVALDWTFQRGPFELIGESAWSHIGNNDKNQDGTKNGNPEKMQGYYIQGNYHFLPEWLSNLAPTFFKKEVSTFTAVVRWEETQLGKDLSGEARKTGEWQRWTFGLNFRPTEDSVFKTDFQYTPVGLDDKGNRISDTAFIASWATYF
ncbi:hypothetical protein [uncultured Nitrospira sp.]|uniref:hypothetical protein n=1 Tax=uncultured Nitrospira sp. TaxID=157176 RepID=UPI003140A0E8